MKRKKQSSSFDEQMGRIKIVTGTNTQIELAVMLGIRQSSISDAKKRQRIPYTWLLSLLQLKNVNPEWILSGEGPQYIDGSSDTRVVSKKENKAILRTLPAKVLADELVRRITSIGGH